MKTTNCFPASFKSLSANGLAILAACTLCLPATALGSGGKTYFKGKETLKFPVPGIQFTDGTSGFIMGWRFYALEEMDDPRVSGDSVIGWNAILDLGAFTGPQWGNFHVENSGGNWDGYWWGAISVGDSGSADYLECTAVGSGEYEGLVARWTYSGEGFSSGLPLHASGYIVEAKGGPAARPFLVKGSRVDQLRMVHGVFINPASGDLLGFGVLGKVDILKGGGQGSHAGLYTEQGLGLLDPATGAVTAMGFETTANGDLLHWVASGITTLSPDGQTAVFEGTVHFAGGTGRFEAASGGFNGFFEEKLEATEDPLASLAKYDYCARGTIRY
jgi:hypothetical protein